MGFESTRRPALHFVDGQWLEGDPPLLSAMSNGSWLGTTVFDGARAIDGAVPDLDRHCARLVRSGRALGLEPPHSAAEIESILREGLARFASDAPVYLRPILWADSGFVAPDPASTRHCYSLIENPLPPFEGVAVTVSAFRRPSPETAPTEAKAACLYPNAGRALAEARRRGFDNAVMLDPVGHVAELTSANLWLVKGGEAVTPVPNGCFLDGITRQRVMALLREAGVTVTERTVRVGELLEADELFSTGNHAKVTPITRIEGRSLAVGPVTRLARQRYFEWASTTR